MANVANLQRLSATALSDILLAERLAADPKVAIVDVRDDDHIGGHIKGSLHFPSRSLEAMMSTLVRRLEGKSVVVFHCALSQQRGPSAALRYMREREGILGKGSKLKDAAGHVAAEASGSVENQTPKEKVEQKVYVLDRGFVGWQELFAEDERLTEGYRKELWEDGYWG